MNLNDNVHQCENFVNGFLIAVFCHNMMNMVAKEFVFGENGGWTLVLHSCFFNEYF